MVAQWESDMVKHRARDYPIDECTKAAYRILHEHPTALIYQKFTCERCNSRQTMAHPNVFYKSGKCEECSHVTDISKRGCNYLVHYRFKGGNDLFTGDLKEDR